MKKETLKKVIESTIILENYHKNRLRDFENEYEDKENIENSVEEWFPKIDALKSGFELLKKEIKDIIAIKKEAEEFLHNLYHDNKCGHFIKISDYSYRRNCYEDTCVLCGKMFFSSSIEKRNNIRDLNNKKTKSATFIGIEDITPSGFMTDEEYITNYTKEDIRKILLDVLYNHSLEDIDIVDEVEKLNLDKCIINKPHNKILILMIIGSNKHYIDEYTYLTSKDYKDAKKIIEYFQELYNVAIEIIGDKESLREYEQNNESIFLTEYETIQDLERELQYEQNIPFNLVIDMSRLFVYSEEGEGLNKDRYQLDLKNMFPVSRIIRIEQNDFQDDIKILTTLKQILVHYNEAYIDLEKKFCFLKDGQVEKINFTDTCKNVKKLILKKEDKNE